MRNVNRVTRFTGACICAGLLVLSAGVPTSAQPAGKTLATLVLNYDVGLTSWNNSLDPANTAFGYDQAVELLIHAGIVRMLPSNRVAGDLAYRWTVSKNRRVYTFYFRKNLHFSNGDPVTAQDAIWSITRAAGKDVIPQTTAGGNLIAGLDEYNQGKASTISGLKAVNSKTLRITITRPAAYFLTSLATSDENLVLDPRIERGHPVGSFMTNTCTSQVGAGPFKPVCQNADTDVTSYYPAGSTPTLTLVPNRRYYGPRAHVNISIPVIPDPGAAYQSYRAGTLHVSTITPLSEVGQWKGTKDFRHWTSSVVQYLQPNTAMPPFDNRHCRLAVAYAWNRDAIANQIYHHTVLAPTYGIVPPKYPASYPGKDSPHYNLARARSELAQCPGGIHVRMPWFAVTVEQRNTRTAFHDMMAAAGIDITPYDVTGPENARVRTHNMRETGTAMNYSVCVQEDPDPGDSCIGMLGEGNIQGWHNATFARLIQQAEREKNPGRRIDRYIRAQQVAIHDGAWITGFNVVSLALVKPYVHGIVFMPYQPQIAARAINGDWSKVSVNNG